MDNRFLSAFTEPTRVKILGRFVYPFCLKHRVRLSAIGSPLLTGEKIEPIDLLIAVQICAEEPVGKLGFVDGFRLVLLRRNELYFTRQLKRFIDYVGVKNHPKFWERKAKEGRTETGVPWELVVVANLMRAGVQEERAWEMPECQAIWLNTAILSSKGVDVQVLTTDEEEFMAENGKEKAESKGESPEAQNT